MPVFHSDSVNRACVVASMVAVLFAALDADAGRRRRSSGKRGRLLLTCSVDGAAVTVGGRSVGNTPIRQQALRSGTHTVAITKLGFLDFTERVEIKPGQTVHLSADLRPVAGVIRVTANVSDARVEVDSKSAGKTPLEREVKIGAHTVTVTAPGYSPYSETISADAGHVYDVVANLGEAPAAEEDHLELTMLPAGTTARALGRGDDLYVEPRAGAGDTEELSLAALPGLEAPASGHDGMEPAALAPLPGGAQARTGGIGTAVAEETPWYLEWWVLSAAAAVLTGAVVTTVALTGGEQEPAICYHAEWTPGQGFSGWSSPPATCQLRLP